MIKKTIKAVKKNDDRTGSMTGAPSPKERAMMDKKPKTLNYHEKAQKFITSAKNMGMKVTREGSEMIATPKKKPTNLRQTTPMIKKKK